MHRLRIDEGSAHHKVAGRQPREEAVKRRGLLRRQAVDSHQVEQPLVEPHHCAELRLAYPGRSCDNGVEHRLDVGRRARDHAQDLARRPLLLHRFGEFGGALVQLSFEFCNLLSGLNYPTTVEPRSCLPNLWCHAPRRLIFFDDTRVTA
jgi:hypothetical protein